MKRRSKASGERAKAQDRNAEKLKHRTASKGAMRHTSSSNIEVARLIHELKEAVEQQSVTSELLGIISSGAAELEPIFRAILEKATRLCDAEIGIIYRWDGDALHLVAAHNTPPALEELRRRSPFHPKPDTPIGQMIATKKVAHVADLRKERGYIEKTDNDLIAAIELSGMRTHLSVPMLKDGELLGAISIYRLEVRSFTEGQIALVSNFAAQAVIAIENARLLNELRQRTSDLSQRTADLTEALEQQTATSEVLQVISRSPGDLEPVFASMLEKAVRICDAKFGIMNFPEPGGVRPVAMHNVPEAIAELRLRDPVVHFGPKHPLARAAATKQVVHIPDLELYADEDAVIAKFRELTGARTILHVPMLRDEELVGIVSIYRQEVRPFTDKQIDLVKNFAAQAVIAIENARLLNELRQRTTDLSEALEQQTATSDVLQVISSSPGDLQPVFATMLEKAVRICDATFGNIYRWDGDAMHLVATLNTPPAFAAEARRRSQYRPDPKTVTGRMLETKAVVHVADLAAESAYSEERHPAFVAGVELGGVRTILKVPMLNEDTLIGSFTVYRQEVRPFTGKQIALVTNFAAQAVIAIENARLLNELRDTTEQVQAQSQELATLNQQLEQRVADQVGEIERMSRLRRFLPPQVADLIVASGSEKQLESHRREITALFCDLRGFTGFSESADPEDVMTLLREYHEAIGESIIKYSGTLERYAGDGVMVVFNDPVPVENPALQAVLMALEMRDAIGALTETWRRWGHDIGFGIGIAHGFATLGTIGFEGRFDYAAIGTVSNVASRLCDEAKPGQILISPRVLTKVENAVQVEPVGEFELKGIRRPLAAYNVIVSE
jgi:class 3 adenylate cyclase/putative methionine-R-sulfoxide reductase with GAF domain